jgi:hypothetical protein
MVSHPAMNKTNPEARLRHIETVRSLRLAHARYMTHFDNYINVENFKEAHYWLTRASEAHQRLLDLGEVAI